MLSIPVALGSPGMMELEAEVPWLLGNQRFERVNFWITWCPRGFLAGEWIFSLGVFLLHEMLVFGSWLLRKGISLPALKLCQKCLFAFAAVLPVQKLLLYRCPSNGKLTFITLHKKW